MEQLAPRTVINAAAYTDVNGAEAADQRTLAVALNRELPARLAGACDRIGAPLVHVSTDYVFDGTADRPYREEDPVAPLQVYGETKLAGEREITERLGESRALIVRVSTLYGPGPRGHYVRAILGQARKRARIEVVRLPVSSPGYTPDLAEGLVELVWSRARGVVHLANGGGCSRLELAREIVRLAGLDVRVDERPVATDPAPRPAYSVLDTSRYTELTGRAMRPWRDALAEYLSAVGSQ